MTSPTQFSADPDQARAALDAARNATAAVVRTGSVPTWYPAVVGGLMVVYGAGSDLSNATHKAWIFPAIGVLYALGIGVAAGVMMRRKGVVQRRTKACIRQSVVAMLVTLVLAGVAYLGASAVHSPLRGTFAAVVAAVVLWVAVVRINRRVDRDVAAMESAV